MTRNTRRLERWLEGPQGFLPKANQAIDAMNELTGVPGQRGRPVIQTYDGKVRVKNTTVSTVPKFGILKLGDVFYDTSDAVGIKEFKQQLVLLGEAPEVAQPFGVLQHPMEAGVTGVAVVIGLTQVKIAVSDAAHEYAVVTDAETGKLASANHGPARIVWKETGTGDKWAVVELLGEPQVLTAKITALANDYVTCKLVDDTGAVVGDDFDVAKPWKLRHLAAEYDGVDSITTGADSNTVTAGASAEDDETWKVRQPYKVDDVIIIGRVQHTDVTVSAVELHWIDLNVDARAWVTPCEQEPE